MLDSLQSALQLLHAEIDCLRTVEKQKTARAGGKAGKWSCWKTYIMWDVILQTEQLLLEGIFSAEKVSPVASPFQ